MKLSRALLIVVNLLMLAIPAHAVYEEGKSQPKGPEFAPGQILVKFRSDASSSAIGEVMKKHRVEMKKVIPGINVHVMRIPSGMPVAEMVRRLGAEVAVVYAEPDYIAKVTESQIPDDPNFSKQWGLNNLYDFDIDAPEGWGWIKGNPNVKIAIIDTGINLNHEDLKPMLVSGYNAINPSKSPNDDNGHGSHVAGIASAATNNKKGIAGVSWGCTLMPVKVLNAAGSGYYSDVSEGIMWAANNGAQVINMSLGGPSDSQTLKDAVNYAWNGDDAKGIKGVLLACAAGNSGDTSPLYPAYYQNCIAVAATDQNDNRAYFSTYGSWVEVAAPGVNILSAYKGKPNNYKYLSGTSMATPHVAGLAGLLYSIPVSDKSPADTAGYGRINDEVREAIEAGCDSINNTGLYWTKGRINACKAIKAVVGGTCP